MLLLLLIFVPIIGIFIILAETSFNPTPANFSSHFPSPQGGNRAEEEKEETEEENNPAPGLAFGLLSRPPKGPAQLESTELGSALTLYKDQQTEERGERQNQDKKNNSHGSHKLIKLAALGASLVNLLISLLVFTLYDFSSNSFSFVQEYHQVSYFDFYLGLDGLSIYFVLLTTIIIPIALLSN